MKRLLYFLLLLHAIVGSTSLIAEDSSPRHWFTKLSARITAAPADIQPIIPVDINGDGIDELALFDYHVGIHLYQHNSRDFIGKIAQKNLTALMAHPAGSSADSEFMISLEDSTTLHLVSVLLSGNKDLSHYEARFDTVFSESLSDPEQIYVGKPLITATVDANHDGVRDYLAFRSYGLMERYRGVLLIDGKSKTEFWHRYFGPLPQNMQICNLDGDGDPEIVVLSCAVGNGRAADGYADSASYLFTFTLDGRDFWPPILLGDKFSRPDYRFIPDSNGRDTNIVVTVFNMKASDAVQTIRIFSGRHGSLINEYSQPGGFRGLYVFNSGSDSTKSIITVSQTGSVFLFDDSLRVRQIRNFPESAMALLPAIDCTGDEVLEFPVLTSDNMLWILDSRLAPLFNRQLGSRIAWLAPMAGPNPDVRDILVAADRPYIMTFFWGSKSFAEIVPPVVQIGIVLSSLAALLIGYLQIRHRRRYFEFLDSVFNDSSRAIIALGANRTITRTNAMADELFDAKHLLLGRRIDSLAEHHSLAPLTPIVMPFLETGGHRLETGVKLLIGNKTREFSLSICRGADAKSGREHVTIIMLQDITELSQAKMYTAWSQVASGLAHDLRKPLAPLKLLLQDLLARTRTREVAVDTVDKDYLVPAMVQVERMAKYIDQLATVASSKDARREEICVSQWLQCLLNEVNSVNGSHPAVALNMEPDLPSLKGNRDDLERVLLELIDNAVTATQNRPESAITVRARLSDQTHGHLRLEVADNGCGIAPEFLPQVFEPYVTTGSGGHRGLGLWTARKIVTEHGGSIEIQSTAGVGTVFVIELPGVVRGA